MSPEDVQEREPTFHVLMVDDEPDLEPMIRQRMRPRIRDGTYSFLFANNGEEALEKIAEDDRLEMMFTDINMPRMDGLTLLKRVNERKPEIKSVVISAYGDMRNIRTAMNLGAFDFVTKPLDFEDFEITLDRTKAHLKQWKKTQDSHNKLIALQHELEMASRMQLAILPAIFPSGREFEVHGMMAPAKVVSGDFYEVIPLEGGMIGVAVADVSDKGIPAALFMMSSRTMLKGAAIGSLEPGQTLSEVNNLLHGDNATTMFVTLLYAVYDPSNGRIKYANAGHCDPIIVNQEGQCRTLPATEGVVLGLASNLDYQQREDTMLPGETLVIYTDGVTEALNPEGDEFGLKGLTDLFAKDGAQSAADTSERVLEAVTEHTGNRERFDDVTCLCIHRKAAV